MTNQNERRADDAMRAVKRFTDCNYKDDPADLFLDVTDLIANLLHLAVERHGMDEDEVLEHARASFHGDSEDGPPAARVD